MEPRAHPWVSAVGRPECRYYDLTASPELIRSALEDLVPWSKYPAAEEFYQLIEQLSRRESTLESNDCEFSGPQPNEYSNIPKSLQCSGRLMVLFRNIETNLHSGAVESLKNELHRGLIASDPDFEWGIIGTTIIPVRYLALPKMAGGQNGTQLMISFWAWGDSEQENMGNLGRLMNNLAVVLAELNPMGIASA